MVLFPRGRGGLIGARPLTTAFPRAPPWAAPRHPRRRCSYTEFFALYTTMMTSENYVLKRQSLKLLSEFLLDRENFRIMMRYISDK